MEASEHHSKAERLIGLAELIAIGFRDPICAVYPHIRFAAKFQQWDFFATVTGVWTAFVRIRYDFPSDQRSTVESLVLAKLASWHPSGLAAFQDLNTFVIQCGLRELEESKRSSLTPLSAGAWILWNITDKKPIDKEHEIAGALGEMFVNEFTIYWLVESEKP